MGCALHLYLTLRYPFTEIHYRGFTNNMILIHVLWSLAMVLLYIVIMIMCIVTGLDRDQTVEIQRLSSFELTAVDMINISTNITLY